MAGPWEKFQAVEPVEQGPWTKFASPPAPPASAGISDLLSAPIQPKPEQQSVFRQVADIPLGIAKGAVQGVRMIADAFGAGTDTSNTIKGAENYLNDLMSAQAKNDQQEIARIMKDAEDKGVLDQVQAGLKAFTVAPVDTLTSALGTAAPAIVAALGAKVLGAGALITTGVGVLTGAGMGAGVVKGTIYEETKKALIEAGVSESVAEERAQRAQEYGGKNLDQILLGAGLGGAAAVGPVEKGIASALARKISTNVAAREAAESVSEKAAKGVLRQRAGAAVVEAVPEATQAAQEKVAENIALQREGFDVPTFRGAVSAATLEGLAGAGLGAIVGGGARTAPAQAPAPITDLESVLNEPAPPETPGVQDAVRVEPSPVGAGFDVSEFTPGAPSPEGVGGPAPSGVGVAGEPAGEIVAGAQVQPTALETPAAPAPAPAPEPAPAPAPSFEGYKPYSEWMAERKQAAAAAAPAPAAPLTEAQIKKEKEERKKQVRKEIAEQETSIGKEYDKDRLALKFPDEATQALYEAAKNKQLPPDQQVGSRRLAETLRNNGIEPDLYEVPAGFSTFTPEQQTEFLSGIAEDIYNDLEAVRTKRSEIPAWSTLTRDGKDVFLSYMTENTPEERARARMQLRTYLDRVAAVQKTTRTKTKAAPEARIYETNRLQYNRILGVVFPPWNSLTDEQRSSFETALRKYSPEQKSERGTSLQHDFAFGALGENLRVEQEKAAEKTRAERKTVPKSYVLSQARIASKQETREAPQAPAPAVPALGWKEGVEPPGEVESEPQPKEKKPAIDQGLLGAIKSNDYVRVLNILAAKTKNPVHREVARRILQLGSGLKINISLVDALPDSRIAEYDPSTNTIRVTEDGLANTTLLHEGVHAVTVRAINKYLNNQALTEQERDAVQQLTDVMNLAKEQLGATYPDAFTDLYEFIAQAMTNSRFQNALAAVETEKLEYAEVPGKPSLWSQFLQSLAKLFPSITRAFSKGKTSALAEVFNSFEQIISVPEAGIEMAALPAKKAKETKPAEELPEQTDAQFEAETLQKLQLKDRGRQALFKYLLSKRGYEWLVRKFQNDRRVIKKIFERAESFKQLKRVGDNVNDVWGQLSRSLGMALDMDSIHIQPLEKQLHEQIEAYAEKAGFQVKDALAYLDAIAKARHEPERRHVKFLKNVPLDNDKKYKVTGFANNEYMSPAAWREYILKQIASPTALTEQQAADLKRLLEYFTSQEKFFDQVKLAKVKAAVTSLKDTAFDESGAEYAVWAGRNPAQIARITRLFYDSKPKEVRDAADAALKTLTEIQDKSIDLNKEANYWSTPTQNIKLFYGWKNYVPYKGKPGKTLIDEDLEFNSRRFGGELQDGQNAFEGRMSEAENSILQTIAEGHQAAMRAGRKDLTLAIKNAIKDKILRGVVRDGEDQRIKFEDRYLGNVDNADLKKANHIFHYEPDGTITILALDDKLELEAIRRGYRESMPIIDQINTATSTIGQMHTRYNPAFAPMNFVRDSLTNAFTLGAELGPAIAGRLIKSVASEVASGGLYRTMNFARLYSDGKFAELNKLAGGTAPYDSLDSKQRYYRDLLEYTKLGGRVSYLQGIAAKGALDGLMKDIGRSGIVKTKEQADRFFDIYNDMFELAARLSAYRALKTEYRNRGESEQEAQIHAVESAKNLANFEQVGEWGKAAGALFMFFRPAATGAVRAIDALRPVFSFNEKDFTEAAQKEGRTQEQIDAAIKDMREKQRTARLMSASLVGTGVAMYLIAMMMSGDDDEGRNRIATDDMARWTRYARFFVPGFENPVQIPWGFGPGAFAAAGAQIASLASSGGNVSFSEALSNIATIGLDSFLPLPFARISPIDNFPAFMMDTITPSIARPFLEYVMNLDGLGREIYNNRQTKYGDAYTGGDNIPEMYKDAARTLSASTNGSIDWSPNTMYFFANSFADGIFKAFSSGYNLYLTATGQKDFNPKADTLFAASFIGTKSNFDARQFSKAENEIKELDKRLNGLKNSRPDLYSAYISENPDKFALVQFYNQQVNGALRNLRSAANVVRANPNLTPGERKEQVDQIVRMQNVVKQQILHGFESISGEKF